MCESIENLIELINKSIKSESENIQEYIKEILCYTNIEYENMNELEDSSDDLNQSLKIIKRLKLLKNKYKRIQSEINELSYYVYKPEEMDSDDELQWEREEMSGKIYTMTSNYTIDSEDETESEKLKKELAKTTMINAMKYKGPKINEIMNNINKKNDTKPIIKNPIKFNRESKSI